MRLIVIFISLFICQQLMAMSAEDKYAKELVSKVYLGGKAYDQKEFDQLSESQTAEDDIRYYKDDYPFMDSVVFKRSLDVSLALSIAHLIKLKKHDKTKHALVGALIGYGVTKLCHYITKNNGSLFCALTGAASSLIVGILKELYDSTGRGTVDHMDAIYTFFPGALISFRLSF